MPRLREVPRREAAHPYVLYMYERKFGDRDFETAPGTATGAPGNWETVFAQVPDILEHAVRGFAVWQSSDRKLDPILRELAMTRVGWACGCQFVFSQHCKLARGVGVTEEQVAAIPSWSVSELFSPAQRAVLAYADALALAHGRTPDGVFEVLKRHLSEEEIIELTYIATMYVMFATMTRALRLEFDDRDDPVAEVPAPPGFVYQPPPSGMALPA
jgi:AhpD family alkylhydroperoxidase